MKHKTLKTLIVKGDGGPYGKYSQYSQTWGGMQCYEGGCYGESFAF